MCNCFEDEMYGFVECSICYENRYIEHLAKEEGVSFEQMMERLSKNLEIEKRDKFIKKLIP